VNPPELRYTSEHEWVRVDDDGITARVGITDYAQEALGDIVYVHIPGVGETVESGAPMGELESTKSVSDLFAPVSGTIRVVNDALDTQPELCNSDPYGDGWIVEITLSDASQLDG
jgi:glycine cleavage system H protein